MMSMLPIGLVLMVLAAVGLARGSGRQDGHVPAVQLLDTRLARGEITSDEYRQRRQVLTAPEIRIEAGDLWFEPDRIEVEAGNTVNLVLDNSGQAFHDLSIPELDLHLEAQPGGTSATAVNVPQAGTYRFACTVPGHAAAGMRGEVVVTPSP